MLKNSLPLGGHRIWLVPLLSYSSSSFSFTLDSVCDSLCLHFPMISERTFSWVQLSGRFPIAFFPSAKAIYILSVLQRSHIFPPALYGNALSTIDHFMLYFFCSFFSCHTLALSAVPLSSPHLKSYLCMLYRSLKVIEVIP